MISFNLYIIIIVVAEEVSEKKCSKELEKTLGPKLGWPCSFHVATDNIVAFELTRLQDFNVIIVAQNKCRPDHFDITDLLTMMKALDGCCPPMIFLTDDETQLAGPGCSDYYYVRCCAGNEFVLDELCAAIHIAVQNTIPSDIQQENTVDTSWSVIKSKCFSNEDSILSDYEWEPTPGGDEFDVLLARMFDGQDDLSSCYDSVSDVSFIYEDSIISSTRTKRVYSFDSDSASELSQSYCDYKKPRLSETFTLDEYSFEEDLFDYLVPQ